MVKPHLQMKREPCEIGDDITSASIPSHLEPVPCEKCAGYQQRISELEAMLAAYERAVEQRAEWAKQSLENNTGMNKVPRRPIDPPNAYHNCCE